MIVIRDYVESDAESLWNLFFNTIRNINRRDYSQSQVEAWASDSYNPDSWVKRMNGISPFVAEIEGVIVGYTDLQQDGLIDHFFCHHHYQGKGVGRALMNHVMEIGHSRGLRRYYSEVSITARPFYEHLGFVVVEEKVVEMKGQNLKYYHVEKTN